MHNLALNGLASNGQNGQTYPIFEANQVLTHEHLNQLREHQLRGDHETRLHAIGAGILGGLRVQLVRDGDEGPVTAIALGCGAGITTHGYIAATEDCELAFARAYRDPAGYPPFWHGDPEDEEGEATQIELFELLQEPTGEEEEEGEQGALFRELAERASDYVLLLYVEARQCDLPTCSALNCNEHGQEVHIDLRRLLVRREDVEQAQPATNRPAAHQPLRLERARDLAGDAGHLAGEYRRICDEAIPRLAPGLTAAWRDYADDLLGEAELPEGEFPAALREREPLEEHLRERLEESPDRLIQNYFDFLRDLVSTHNELTALCATLRVRECPEPGAFPRHLLVRELAAIAPRERALFRHEFRGAPYPQGAGATLRRAQLLYEKEQRMLVAYLPSAEPDEVRVQPQRRLGPSADLMPHYYADEDGLLAATWSAAADARQEAEAPRRYAEAGDPEDGALSDVHDDDRLYRIEGHLGREDALAVAGEVEAIRDALRLAFDVQLLVAGADPPWASPPLTHVEVEYQARRSPVMQRLRHAALTLEQLRRSPPGWLRTFRDSLLPPEHLVECLRALLAALEAVPEPEEVAERYRELLDAAARYRATLVVEALYPPPAEDGGEMLDPRDLSGGVGGHQPPVADWARGVTALLAALFEEIDLNPLLWIAADLRRERERHAQRFEPFTGEHPGLDHLAGVPKGGTFLLVAAEDRVIADFALPYRCCEPAAAAREAGERALHGLYVESAWESRVEIDLSTLAAGAAEVTGRGVADSPLGEPDAEFAAAVEDAQLSLEAGSPGLYRVDLRLEGDGMEAREYRAWVALLPPLVVALDDIAVTVEDEPVRIHPLINDLVGFPGEGASLRIAPHPARHGTTEAVSARTVEYRPLREGAYVDVFDYEVIVERAERSWRAGRGRVIVHVVPCCAEGRPPDDFEEPGIAIDPEIFCHHDQDSYPITTTGVILTIEGPGVVADVRLETASGRTLVHRVRAEGDALRVEESAELLSTGGRQPLTTNFLIERASLVRAEEGIAAEHAEIGSTIDIGGLRFALDDEVLERLAGEPAEGEATWRFRPAHAAVEPGENTITFRGHGEDGQVVEGSISVMVYELPNSFDLSFIEWLTDSQGVRARLQLAYAPRPVDDRVQVSWQASDGQQGAGTSAQLLVRQPVSVQLVAEVAGLPDCRRQLTRSFNPPGPTIEPGAIGVGFLGQPFSSQVTASGGVAPYQFQRVAGSFPAGIGLQPSSGNTASGTISIAGVPTQPGPFNFTLRVTDAWGRTHQRDFFLFIESEPVIIEPPNGGGGGGGIIVPPDGGGGGGGGIVIALHESGERFASAIESDAVLRTVGEEERARLSAGADSLASVVRIVEADTTGEELRSGRLDPAVHTLTDRALRETSEILLAQLERGASADDLAPLAELFASQVAVVFRYVTERETALSAEMRAMLDDVEGQIVRLARAGVPLAASLGPLLEESAGVAADAELQERIGGLAERLNEIEGR